MNWLRVGEVGLIVAAIGQTLFVAIYATRPFWRHFVGRALLTKSAALMVLLWVSVLNLWVTYPHQLEVAVVLTWAIALAILYQLVALLRQIRLDRSTT